MTTHFKLLAPFTLVLALLASVASPASADTKPRVIAVINRADWCSSCKANGPRVAKAVMAASADGSLAIVMNDLTSDKTAKTSGTALKAAGVDAAMVPYTATGVLYLFDAATKHVLKQVTVANSNAEILMAIDAAKKAAGG